MFTSSLDQNTNTLATPNTCKCVNNMYRPIRIKGKSWFDMQVNLHVQCVPIKRKPFYQWDIFIATQSFIKLYASLWRAFFSSFIDTKHMMISQCMTEKEQFKLLHWVDMTKFRLANPCQNKESKQKKHDKRDKRNANECLFNTSLCSKTWQTPLSP